VLARAANGNEFLVGHCSPLRRLLSMGWRRVSGQPKI